MSADLRRHARFVSREKVEVELIDRAELREVWTTDISQGGMFLETNEPPSFGSRLEIRLSTPDGAIALTGNVVHVVDLEAAQAFGAPRGVGVQFVDLSPAIRERIERYVKGIEERLTADLRVDPNAAPLETVLARATGIAAALAASDLYGALGVSPAASLAEVQKRVEELCRQLTNLPPECSPGKAARLAQLARQLERTSALFANPLRRLHFDFNHGHIRIEERRAAGEDFAYLRTVWSEAFPDRINKAKEIARQAILADENGRLGDAAHLAHAAIELDPFNDELRVAERSWRQGRAVTPPPLPVEALVVEKVEIDPSKALQELLAINNKLKSMSHLELLGVEEGASIEAVTTAYLERSGRYDPQALRDRVPASVLGIAAEYRRRLETAYKSLTDKTLHKNDPVPGSARSAADANTKNEMGIVSLRKQDYAAARELFRAAMELDADNEDYQANFAWTLIVDSKADRAEAFKTAKPLLENALAKAPQKTNLERKRRARYLFYLGRLLRIEGQLQEARTHFEAAVHLDSSLTEAATELRLIEANLKKSEPVKKGFFKR